VSGATERRRRSGRTEERRSGAHPDARDPQRLGAAVQRLLADRGWQTEVSVGAVLGRWPEVVGPDLAAHCTPEGFTDGELSVRADSTAWATQLRLLAPELIGRLNAQAGPGTVSRVRVLGPAGPSWRRGPRGVHGRGPRDTYG
jgi:predicted nucleic acid-binding Zn ribbon protein